MIYSAANQFGTLRAKVPCRPNPSRVTTLLTSGLRRLIYRHLYKPTPFLFIFVFVFHQQIDGVLQLLGYDAKFVSYFPFLRTLYARLDASVWLNHVSVTYFHVLDATLWLSLAIWGARLAAGLIFLKQYDDLYLAFSIRTKGVPRERVYVAYAGTLWLFVTPFFINYALMQPKILNDPEVLFIVTSSPTVYFLSLAVIYFFTAGFVAEVSLFLLWKFLRQKRPGVILWQRSAIQEGS